jgi:hypothetical protein
MSKLLNEFAWGLHWFLLTVVSESRVASESMSDLRMYVIFLLTECSFGERGIL